MLLGVAVQIPQRQNKSLLPILSLAVVQYFQQGDPLSLDTMLSAHQVYGISELSVKRFCVQKSERDNSVDERLNNLKAFYIR